MKKIILFLILLACAAPSLAQINLPTDFVGFRTSDPNCARAGLRYWNTVSLTGKVCTATGTPGTWIAVGGASSPLSLTASSASEVPLTVKGAASQSADLQQWVNNSNAVLAKVDSSGAIFATKRVKFVDSGDFEIGNLYEDGNGYIGINNGKFFAVRDNAGNLVFQVRGTANGSTGSFYKGGNVASAASITPTGNLFHVTGTTAITSISSTNVSAGTCLTIIFDDALTLTDGSNLKLAGNFATTADDSWSGCYDGSNWHETARSVN